MHRVYFIAALLISQLLIAREEFPAPFVDMRVTAEYHFAKPTGNPNEPSPGRFIIYERDAPDAFPLIEVLIFPEITRILLPPGFLGNLPDSATTQALLFKHLKLLPRCYLVSKISPLI